MKCNNPTQFWGGPKPTSHTPLTSFGVHKHVTLGIFFWGMF